EDLRDLFVKTDEKEWRNMFTSAIEQNGDFATFRQRLLTNPSELAIDPEKLHSDAYRGWTNLWTGITLNGAQMYFRGKENIQMPQFNMGAVTNQPQQNAPADTRVAELVERPREEQSPASADERASAQSGGKRWGNLRATRQAPRPRVNAPRIPVAQVSDDRTSEGLTNDLIANAFRQRHDNDA
ncbi:MAG: hypothetical protein J6U64_01190, partial [Alphaproteobacteria bacterium]|nr:hypothetical protein [Alphaproteobacteria bacterium]